MIKSIQTDLQGEYNLVEAGPNQVIKVIDVIMTAPRINNGIVELKFIDNANFLVPDIDEDDSMSPGDELTIYKKNLSDSGCQLTMQNICWESKKNNTLQLVVQNNMDVNIAIKYEIKEVG